MGIFTVYLTSSVPVSLLSDRIGGMIVGKANTPERTPLLESEEGPYAHLKADPEFRPPSGTSDRYYSTPAIWKAHRANYFKGEKKLASSRESPAKHLDIPLGSWRIDDGHKGIHGHEIDELQAHKPRDITPHVGEMTWEKGMRDRARHPDVKRYADWLEKDHDEHESSGGNSNVARIPPLSVTKHDKGHLRIGDGHRRLAAVDLVNQRREANGKHPLKVPAWTSWTAKHPEGLKDSEGQEMKVGLTHQIASRGEKIDRSHSKPVTEDTSLTELRASCLDCCRKHLSQALILMQEVHQGYPAHRWIAIGHMGEAADEALKEHPKFADEIRKHRIKYMGDADYDVPIMDLIEKASKLAGDVSEACDHDDVKNSGCRCVTKDCKGKFCGMDAISAHMDDMQDQNGKWGAPLVKEERSLFKRIDEDLSTRELSALDVMSERFGFEDEFWVEHRKRIKSGEFSPPFEDWLRENRRSGESRQQAWLRHLNEERAERCGSVAVSLLKPGTKVYERWLAKRNRKRAATMRKKQQESDVGNELVDEEREASPDGHITCGVFLPIPYSLAKDFPNKRDEDDSVPHYTVLYAGPMCPKAYRGFCDTVRKLAQKIKPFEMDLAYYGEFLNPSGQKIPHMSPSIRARMRLGAIHGLLRRAVELTHGTVAHHYGGDASDVPPEIKFKPHATLDYLPSLIPYKGPKPTGAWQVTELECWGHERIQCPLGMTKATQPLGLTRDPITLRYPSAVPDVVKGGAEKPPISRVVILKARPGFLTREALLAMKPKTEDLIPGGRAAGRDPSEFDPKEIAMGIKVEKEHLEKGGYSPAEMKRKAQEIAMDHLAEFSDYYSRLKKMEKEGDVAKKKQELSLKRSKLKIKSEDVTGGSMGAVGKSVGGSDGDINLAASLPYQSVLQKAKNKLDRTKLVIKK